MLTGKKIVLRALEREDLKLVHKWQNDEEVMRLTRSFPDHIISMEALESRYEKALKGGDFEERQYIIVEKASNMPVGMARIMITLFWKRATSADIGLMIAEKDSRGKGYGTEVVQLLLKEVFEQLNLHRAAWWTVTSNIPSVALAKKVGFKEEGLLREEIFFDNKYHDAVVFGLLRKEYEAGGGQSSADFPHARLDILQL